MNKRTCCRIGAYGTIVSGLCCFGALGALLGLFGATTLIAYVNQFGDYVLLPAYGAFATLLIYGMLSMKKNVLTYFIMAVVAGIAIYLSLSIQSALLTLGGILISLLIIWRFRK